MHAYIPRGRVAKEFLLRTEDEIRVLCLKREGKFTEKASEKTKVIVYQLLTKDNVKLVARRRT